MKAACIILSVLIMLSILAVCVMVKFAADINVDERKRDYWSGTGVYHLAKTIGVIDLENNNRSFANAYRFPYVAAIIKNSSTTWSFVCFASIIMMKWVVTAAHCRVLGATYRVLLYYDFAKNSSRTYAVPHWHIHEKYNSSQTKTPKYDIAVAKMNIDIYPFDMKPSFFDYRHAKSVEASVWKTVATMDKKVYLTNDFDKFEMNIVSIVKCARTYRVKLDESFICVDLTHHDDCFVHEFGPLYFGDKLVGILALKPRECDVKLAIFTNVSYYTNWILTTTHAEHYG